METSPILANALTTCTACQSSTLPTDALCDSCGYPLKGTEQEQTFFIGTRTNLELDLAEQRNKVKKAGIILKFIGGISAVYGIILYFTYVNEIEKIVALILSFILGGIYFSLGIWSKKKPLAAIVTGFIIYMLILILDALVDPKTILQGLILKIIVIGAFVTGIKGAIEAEKIRKEHNL